MFNVPIHENGSGIGETPVELIWVVVNNFVVARNVSFNVDGVMKIAEEKFSKEIWQPDA
jgi:hypothetical protein